MIIIKMLNGFEIKYYGLVSIVFDDDMIFIEAHNTQPSEKDGMMIWYSSVYDWFYNDDIDSIIGVK